MSKHRHAKVPAPFVDNVLGSEALGRALEEFTATGVVPTTMRLHEFGLPLSYIEDRLVTTLQVLTFELHSYGHRDGVPTRPMTPQAQERWGWSDPVPILEVDRREFINTYYFGAPHPSKRDRKRTPGSDAQLKLLNEYLQQLADRVFTFAFWPAGTVSANGTPAPARCVTSNLFALRYRYDKDRIVGLDIALSPIFLVGVYDGYDRADGTGTRFIQKDSDLYARLDKALGVNGQRRRGRVSPLLPRLYYAHKRFASNRKWSISLKTMADRLRQPYPATASRRQALFQRVHDTYDTLSRAGLIERMPYADPADPENGWSKPPSET